jgi:phosphonate transport system substrate-binding protein
MAAAFVSEAGIEVYEKIFKYLEKKLGRKITFVSGFSYETINTMLDSGMVDVGFICGLPYTLKHDAKPPSVDLIAAPVMMDKKYDNKPVYYSYIITHKDNKATKFQDLRGSTFTYNDEISNSGYNMPRAYMIELGETSGFFGKIKRSGSHEESIRQIASKEADVSAVDSLVYDYDLLHNNNLVSETKILKVLGPAGIPPVVISTKTSAETRNIVRDALLDMHNDPEGRIILQQALVDRFAPVEDGNYDSIRKMQKIATEKGYMTIR